VELKEDMGDEDEFNLLEIPANRMQLSPLALQANLQQAHEKFLQGAEVLFVVFNEEQSLDKTPSNIRIYGVVTRNMVDASYKV